MGGKGGDGKGRTQRDLGRFLFAPIPIDDVNVKILSNYLPNYEDGNLAEWSKALVSGTSLRAWVRIPQLSRIKAFKLF